MKTIIKITALIALLFSTATAVAHEPKFRLVPAKNAKSLIFELEAHPKGTQIRMLDAQDHVIYSENMVKATYTKKFDLTKLAAGRYYFVMDNPIRTTVYSLDINDTEVSIVERKEKTKPIFRQKGGMVFLNLLNLNAGNVEIKILDSSNRMVYSHVEKGSQLIEKAFNFENAFEDKYTIVVKDESTVYYENVSIK